MNDGILPTPEERAKEGQVQKELKKEKQEKDLIQLQSDQAKAQISQARFTKAIVIISVIMVLFPSYNSASLETVRMRLKSQP